MKTSDNFPPNYSFIKEILGDIESDKPIFCFGDTIYNPFGVKLTPDLERHEEVHSEQQSHLPEVWWNKYLLDKDFRLSQEIEAYGEQFVFIKSLPKITPKLIEWFQDRIASSLASPLYGRMISYGEAVSKIRHYAKNRV